MIVKHLIIVLMELVLLLSAAFYIFATTYLQPSNATKDTIFGATLNTTTIMTSANTTNKIRQDSTIGDVVHSFEESFTKLVNDTRSLSLSYQNEIGKWQLNQYDNGSMISITNDYLIKFQGIAKEFQELKPPSEGYRKALDLFANQFNRKWQAIYTFETF